MQRDPREREREEKGFLTDPSVLKARVPLGLPKECAFHTHGAWGMPRPRPVEWNIE